MQSKIIYWMLSFVLLGFIAAQTLGLSLTSPGTLWVDSKDNTCGGFSPCYRTIQDAVAVAQAGDTIRVRPGTYQGPITINKDLTLMGESKESVFVEGSDPDRIAITIAKSGNVKIADLSIVDNTRNHGGVGVLIQGPDSQVTLSRIHLSHYHFGILLAVLARAEPPISPASGQLIVLDSEVSDSLAGIYILSDGSYPHRIEGNQFANAGMVILGKGAVTVLRNRFSLGSGIGIGGSLQATIRENVIDNEKTQENQVVLAGISIGDSAQVQLEDNQITNNANNGVIVRDNARVKLVRNQVLRNGLRPASLGRVFFAPTNPFFVSSSTQFEPEGFGVVVGPGASAELIENKITDNLIAVGAARSLDLASKEAPARLTMQKNQLKDNDRGVWLRGADATLIDNEIIGTNLNAKPLFLLDALYPPAGIMLQDGKPLLQSNRILENRVGVLLQQQASPIFLANQIRDNADYGIALYRRGCFPQFAPELEFKGQLQGENNELSGNKTSDLCPKDYLLPPGFLK